MRWATRTTTECLSATDSDAYSNEEDMARKLRPLTLADLSNSAICCSSCAYWESDEQLDVRCGVKCDEEHEAEWYHRVAQEWGDCGRVAYEDDKVLGFIKYAPSGYFPQAWRLPVAPDDPKVPLIACMHIVPDARHHGLGTVLMRAAFRDLILRGERKVEAFGSAHKPAVLEESPMLGMEFLLRNGFVVVKPDPRYPLLRLDLRSLAVITDNLEGVLESLKIPLRMPERAPVPW